MRKLFFIAALTASTAAFAGSTPSAAPAGTAAESRTPSKAALEERMAQRQLDLLIASVLDEHGEQRAEARNTRTVVASAKR